MSCHNCKSKPMPGARYEETRCATCSEHAAIPRLRGRETDSELNESLSAELVSAGDEADTGGIDNASAMLRDAISIIKTTSRGNVRHFAILALLASGFTHREISAGLPVARNSITWCLRQMHKRNQHVALFFDRGRGKRIRHKRLGGVDERH